MHLPEDDEPTDPIPVRKVGDALSADEEEAGRLLGGAAGALRERGEADGHAAVLRARGVGSNVAVCPAVFFVAAA